YPSSSVPALFQRHGLQCSPLFPEVMSGTPHWGQSVWDLKQRIDQLAAGTPPATIIPSVYADYGYMNCKSTTDGMLLDSVYKSYFARPGADPLALHEACIRGKLFKYLEPLVRWPHRQRGKYARLLRNLY
ncbi:hypothetical protein OH77DRAFT_1384013, partial [Trametes cingulata]